MSFTNSFHGNKIRPTKARRLCQHIRQSKLIGYSGCRATKSLTGRQRCRYRGSFRCRRGCCWRDGRAGLCITILVLSGLADTLRSSVGRGRVGARALMELGASSAGLRARGIQIRDLNAQATLTHVCKKPYIACTVDVD
ncbi:hypothetical protein DPMN_154622 [Dreissena polymorpha]|uniref:Uncharacterized protein n=1 Tax=Dreissena polymorpha TaxID=45954 RepID=A0A9D4FLC9_DREPO|nr:hypothetical protein DPMN_154622 [Dreissena polymorpha]